MKKFLVIYYAPVAAMEQMAKISKEDQAKGMEAWFQWKANNESNILDFGAPLMPGQSLDKSEKWSASNKEVTGYSIVQGEAMEDIKSIFKGHPHLSWADGCEIDVHECANM